MQIFNASVSVSVGDGSAILFWEDPWISGHAVEAIAPAILNMVKPGVKRRRTVREGLANAAWARDIGGVLSVDAVVQFMQLWSAVASTMMTGDGNVDRFMWKWNEWGIYTSASAYRVFFYVRMALPGTAQLWHLFTPFWVKFHAWLALRKRC
jgi:hypothetical protein